MAIGKWREMPASNTRSAPEDPPGHPILTGFNQGQAAALQGASTEMNTVMKNMPKNSMLSNGGTGDSVADASEDGAETSGQSPKAEWSLWWGPVLR